MKHVTVKGDQVFVDQGISGQDVIINRHPKKRADPVIAIKGDAVAVCYQHQEQVEQQFMMRETLKEAVS